MNNKNITWVEGIPDFHTNTFFERKEEENEKQNLVVKSNLMIQKSRYNLSLQEQKVILYCISKIKPQDKQFNIITVDIKKLCSYCQIEANGKNYQNFKDAIQELRNKSFWLKNNEAEILCSWVEKVKINIGKLTAEIKLDENLMPYLLQLKENFTAYELENILSMKSKYAVSLYELLKSYSNIGAYEVRVQELKEILQTAEYKEFNNFRVKVLDKAISEINKYTDIKVGFSTKRENRKITKIYFRIYTLEDYEKDLEFIENLKKGNKK